MKIERIKMTNITSLRGEHCIDFKTNLEGEQLFAITGQTGSGKSSLLTAISLALYGKGHKKSLNAQDYVSLGADYASVELEFHAKGKSYLASWQYNAIGARGKRLAEPDISRSVFCQGERLEQKAFEIVGLSFEQFNRTVILNQGEFARFLTASFLERKEILESLYDGDNLAQLNKTLRLMIKDLTTQADGLKQIIDSMMPMSTHDYQQLLAQLETQNQQDKERAKEGQMLAQVQEQLKAFFQILSSWQQMQIKLASVKEQALQAAQQLFQGQIIAKKFEDTEALVEEKGRLLRPIIEQALKSSIHYQTCEQQSKQLAQRLQELSDEEQDKNQRTHQLTLELKSQQKELQKLKNELPDSLNLEQVLPQILLLKDLIIQYEEQRKDQQYQEHQLNLISSRLKEIKILGDKNKQDLQSLNQKRQALLEKEQRPHDITQAQLNLHYEQQWQKEQDYQKHALLQQRDQQDEASYQLSFHKCITELNQQQEQLTKLSEQTKLTDRELKHSEEILLLLNQQQQLQTLVNRSLDSHHCALCQGPITKELQALKLESDQQEKQQKIYQNLSDQQKKLSQELAVCQNRIDQLKKQKIELDEQRLIRQQAFTAELEKLKIKKGPPEAIKEQWDLLTKELEQLKKLLSNLATLDPEIHLQQNELENRRHEYKKTQDEQNKILHSLSELEKRNSTIKSQLNALGIIEFDDLAKLRENLNQWPVLNHSLNLLNQQKALLEKETAQIKTAFGKTQEVLKQNNAEKSRHTSELMGHWTSLRAETQEFFPQLAKINDFEEFSKQLSQIQDQARSDKEREQKKLQILRSKNDQAQSFVTGLEENISLQLRQLKVHQARFIQLEKDYPELTHYIPERWLKKITLLEERELDDKVVTAFQHFYEDEALLQIEKRQKQIELENQKQIELKTQIRMYEEKNAQRQEKLKELKIIEQELKIKNDLYLLIGKDDFRHFALGLIEADLAYLTNKELKQLCDGRYQIKLVAANKGHEFYIVDYWAQATTRKVDTLSGGETFLVSLAMALSLAEMSRGQTEIDSFFIDEGFGTLDQDSLEEALDILMSVQARGKQMGIISHVKELTERIPVNIHLKRGSLGESQIEIVHH